MPSGSRGDLALGCLPPSAGSPGGQTSCLQVSLSKMGREEKQHDGFTTGRLLQADTYWSWMSDLHAIKHTCFTVADSAASMQFVEF